VSAPDTPFAQHDCLHCFPVSLPEFLVLHLRPCRVFAVGLVATMELFAALLTGGVDANIFCSLKASCRRPFTLTCLAPLRACRSRLRSGPRQPRRSARWSTDSQVFSRKPTSPLRRALLKTNMRAMISSPTKMPCLASWELPGRLEPLSIAVLPRGAAARTSPNLGQTHRRQHLCYKAMLSCRRKPRR